jgi:hypothetical protein
MNLIKRYVSKQYFSAPIFCVLALVGFKSFAVTSQELMDRLDDIESAQQQREMNRLMDEYTRVMTQPRPYSAPLSPNITSTSVKKGCNANNYKTVYLSKTDGVRVCILKDSIWENTDNSFELISLMEEDKPSYLEGVTYFNHKLNLQIMCREKKFKVFNATLLDKNFNEIKVLPVTSPKFENNGKIMNEMHKFLCDKKQ